MKIYTGYTNTIALTEDAVLTAASSETESIDVYNSRSNRHMAHIPKDKISTLLRSGSQKKARISGHIFWRCIIPKECEIKIK